MLTGWMSAESSLWELLFSVGSHGLSLVTLLGEKARRMEGGGERAISLCLSLSLSFFFFFAVAAAKSLQLCPTLSDPIDGSPPGSPVPEILQVKTLGGLPFPSPLLFFLPKFKSS